MWVDTLTRLHLANLPCAPTAPRASVRQGMPTSPPSDSLRRKEPELSLDWVVPASKSHHPTRRGVPQKEGIMSACASLSLSRHNPNPNPGGHLASR